MWWHGTMSVVSLNIIVHGGTGENSENADKRAELQRARAGKDKGITIDHPQPYVSAIAARFGCGNCKFRRFSTFVFDSLIPHRARPHRRL